MNKSITVAELQNQSKPRSQFIDVRSPSEFAVGHIPGAINLPLDQIESRLGDLDRGSPIVLICQMGKRAQLAATLLDRCGLQLLVLEGGTNAWMKARLPVVSSTKVRWSLERQVRFGAGFLVLVGIILAFLVSPYWLYLSGFVGLGLMFAGLTDICPMAHLLVKMPWNGQSHCRLSIPSTETGSHAK